MGPAGRERRKKDLARIERQLAKLQSRIDSVHDEMAASASDYQRLAQLDSTLGALAAEHDELETAWLEAADGHDPALAPAFGLALVVERGTTMRSIAASDSRWLVVKASSSSRSCASSPSSAASTRRRPSSREPDEHAAPVVGVGHPQHQALGRAAGRPGWSSSPRSPSSRAAADPGTAGTAPRPAAAP